MGAKKLALEEGGPQRLELSWGLAWKKFTVILDGKVVGTTDGGSSELKKGVNFTLPDGSTLSVQIQSGVFNVELAVLRNGLPLPGSSTDPEQRIKSAAYMLYFLAGLNTLLGVVAMVTENEALTALGMGVGSLLFGAVTAVFGFFTYRGTRAGPILAILLYLSDTVLTVMDTINQGGKPQVFGLIIRAYIVITLVKAVQAAGELKRRGEAGVSLQP
ncbi:MULTISPECIES: hypothetical protein [Myxococcus]|uniref:Uncharacterized protein n=1 Tax=Myxococcus llanfairpwllgwyngyllgogerychwyrndrobwllllantysiliogogogochensis TaxID=2590453 RepID=A0A540X8H2_9BACT|nr:MULTISPECIES: hypothetical protein [Myxococcus]NTX08760.1 hypothetical protein [Myxococcus sp. CA040A]TQF17530.1 hypothetical protein FJV41_02675 [Myxococcus llanfairpwllgwyngyllgogerychwyrndrobwllllantysiliogogogochensis]